MTLDLSKLLVELGHINELPVPISDEDLQKLKDEKKRTGLTGGNIFKLIANPPKGLTKSIAGHIVDGRVQNAEPTWIKAIVKTYSEQPDSRLRPISKKQKEALIKEEERTSLKRTTIFRGLENPPKGLTVAIAKNMGISGRYKDKADPEWVKAILEGYSLRKDSKARPLSSNEIKELQDEAERTGLKGPAIFTKIKKKPEGLTRSIANHIVLGKRRYVEPEWVEIILSTYKKLPRYNRVPVTNLEKQILSQERERTGIAGKALFSLIQKPPKKMDASAVQNIVGGNVNTAISGWVDLILETYRKQPDFQKELEYVRISEQDQKILRAEKERTALGAVALFRKVSVLSNMMSAASGSNIIKGKSKVAPKLWVRALITAYTEQPDAPIHKKGLRPVNENDFEKLQAEKERTGLGGGSIFSLMKRAPKGLSTNLSVNIVSGMKKNAKPEWITALLKAYSQQPSVAATDRLETKIKKIFAESKRTALSGYVIFGYMVNPPEGLTATGLSRIVSGERKTSVPEEWLDSILDEYAKQPDMQFSTKLPEDKILEIKKHKKRTRLGAHALFNRMANPPEGLNPSIIGGIIAGSRHSAKPDWVDAVLNTYRAQPDTRRKPIKEADQTKILQEKNRTRVSGTALFTSIDPRPEGLTKKIVIEVVNGRQKITEPEFVVAIIEAYKKQPTSPLSFDELQPVQEDDQKLIISEYKRTGLGPYAIRSKIVEPAEGFTDRMVQSILDGRKTNVKPTHVSLLIQAYKEQPDAPYKLEPISRTGVEKLKSEAQRTGLGGMALFTRIKEGPAGLTGPMAREIIKGNQKNADPRWVPFLLAEYKKLPTSTKVDVTPDLTKNFEREVKRTGVTSGALFKKIKNPPIGLNSGTVIRIISGRAKTAEQEHLSVIVQTYRSLPSINIIP